MNLDSRTATVAATILSTCALLTVTVTLPLFFQKVQRTNTILMANVYNCHQHSNDIWHQLAHENVRGKRSAYGMGASKLQAGQCCSCQMGGPGMPGPQGPPGEDGRPGMIGRNGANGRDGKYIVIETPDEEKHCQKCGPAPPGPPGYPGPKGPRGMPGAAGEPGKDGQNGMKGPQGPFGVRGQPGEIGMQGPRGDPGSVINGAPQGPQGGVGKIGPRGRSGNPGRDGLPGRQGIKGSPGAPGERGREGRRGNPGPPGTIGPVGGKGSCSHCTPSNDRPSHIPPGTYSDPRTEYGELPEQLISNSYSSDSKRPSAPHPTPTSSSYDSSGSQSSRAYSSKSGYSHSADLQPPTGNSDDSLVPLPSYSDLPDRPQTIDYKEIQPIAPKHAGDYSAAGNFRDNSQQASGYETAHRPAGRKPGYDAAQLEALGYADRPVGSGSRDRSNSNDYSGVGGGSLSSHFGASAPSTSQSYRSQSSGSSAGHSNAATESSQHEHVPATQQHSQHVGARAHAPTSYSRQLQTRQGYNVRVMASGSYGALPVGEMLRRTPPNPFGNFPRYASPPGAATAYRLL